MLLFLLDRIFLYKLLCLFDRMDDIARIFNKRPVLLSLSFL